MKKIEDIINESGYPLQIHLEKLIAETYQLHKWRILVSEHRWFNHETKEEGFIDFILEHSQYNMKLVVECKRISGSWTFLLPTLSPINKYKARVLCADYEQFIYVWTDLDLEPNSSEALYCVLETDGKKDTRTLEKFTEDLLLSLEYLAVEESHLYNAPLDDRNPKSTSIYGKNMVYIPVIVTTAKLSQITFDPANVDIGNGKIIDGKSQISHIEFIRFRKNLATNIEYKETISHSLRDLNRENDRTIFVVQAENFIDFLRKIDS